MLHHVYLGIQPMVRKTIRIEMGVPDMRWKALIASNSLSAVPCRLASRMSSDQTGNPGTKSVMPSRHRYRHRPGQTTIDRDPPAHLANVSSSRGN